MSEKNTMTPREEFESEFNFITDEQWQWLKEFCESHYIPSTKQMMWTSNGDMITKPGQVFRQVGWQINGGVNDGVMLHMEESDVVKSAPHGGYSPIYVEVGMD